MSRESQKRLLNTLLDELESSKVKAYRRATADKQTHNFKLTRRAVIKGMKDYINFYFGQDIPKTVATKVVKKIDSDIYRFIKNVGQNIVNLAAKDDTVESHKFTRATVHATFNYKEGKSRYDKAYSRYSAELKELAEEFSKAVSETLNEEQNVGGGKILQLSHAELEGIIESAVADAIEEAVKKESEISKADVIKFFANRGVDVRVVRNTKTMEMNVAVASAVENAEDKDASKQRINELREAIVDALAELEAMDGTLSGLPGSDSFVQIKKKQIRQKAIAPFKKIKGVKVSSENLEIKHSKVVTRKRKKGNTTAKAAIFARKATKQRRKAGQTSFQPLKLIAEFNKQLPNTVRNNMGAPRLENRSGRFAESVKVTEITQTRKGYPSVGYTYRRDPYQVFETGTGKAPWADGSRDPRELIDKSIREIATQFAMGRFYTRRI